MHITPVWHYKWKKYKEEICWKQKYIVLCIFYAEAFPCVYRSEKSHSSGWSWKEKGGGSSKREFPAEGGILIMKISLYTECLIRIFCYTKRQAKMTVCWYFKKQINFSMVKEQFSKKVIQWHVFWFFFFFADTMFFIETMIIANSYLNSTYLCLLCTFQRLKSFFNNSAVQWSAT